MKSSFKVIILLLLFNCQYAIVNAQFTTTSGANIYVSSGAAVSVSGDVQNDGELSGNGTLLLNGSSSQSITGTGSINNLEVNTSGTATITSGMQSINNVLTLTGGTLSANGNLTMKSVAGSDSRMAVVTGGTITGDVTVERFIPAYGNRAWQLLAVPIQSSGAPTLFNSWQEGGNSTAGYGTQITNYGGAAVTGSWDAGVNGAPNSSLKYYDATTNTLPTPTGTNIPITDRASWFLYVRGDRTVSGSGNSSNTTLRMTGQLKTGDQDQALSSTNFTLVSNPYVSQIDFAAAFANTATTNVLEKFWVWDPKLNVSGGYVLFDGTLGYTPTVTGGSYSGATSTIQSGQGFFVRSNGNAGNLRIEENDKVVDYLNAFKTTAGNDTLLKIKLNMPDPDNSTSYLPADGIIAALGGAYSANVDDEDGRKFWNFGANLSFKRSTSYLSIEKYPFPMVTDTLHLFLHNMGSSNYQFEIDPQNFAGSNLNAYLLDLYQNTLTPLDLNNLSIINFATNSNAGSYGNRFKIVFQNAIPLAEQSLQLFAKRESNDIRLQWNNLAEQNQHSYELERSADGTLFEKVYSAAAKQNNGEKVNYQWADEKPLEGENYYRVKALAYNNDVLYSPTVRISATLGAGTIAVAPNPVKGNIIGLHFTGVAGGNYIVRLYNSTGQEVYAGSITHANGSATYTMHTGTLAKGIYLLQVEHGAYTATLKVISP